jgi:hypothetical protein
MCLNVGTYRICEASSVFIGVCATQWGGRELLLGGVHFSSNPAMQISLSLSLSLFFLSFFDDHHHCVFLIVPSTSLVVIDDVDAGVLWVGLVWQILWTTWTWMRRMVEIQQRRHGGGRWHGLWFMFLVFFRELKGKTDKWH